MSNITVSYTPQRRTRWHRFRCTSRPQVWWSCLLLCHCKSCTLHFLQSVSEEKTHECHIAAIIILSVMFKGEEEWCKWLHKWHTHLSEHNDHLDTWCVLIPQHVIHKHRAWIPAGKDIPSRFKLSCKLLHWWNSSNYIIFSLKEMLTWTHTCLLQWQLLHKLHL